MTVRDSSTRLQAAVTKSSIWGSTPLASIARATANIMLAHEVARVARSSRRSASMMRLSLASRIALRSGGDGILISARVLAGGAA